MGDSRHRLARRPAAPVGAGGDVPAEVWLRGPQAEAAFTPSEGFYCTAFRVRAGSPARPRRRVVAGAGGAPILGAPAGPPRLLRQSVAVPFPYGGQRGTLHLPRAGDRPAPSCERRVIHGFVRDVPWTVERAVVGRGRRAPAGHADHRRRPGPAGALPLPLPPGRDLQPAGDVAQPGPRGQQPRRGADAGRPRRAPLLPPPSVPRRAHGRPQGARGRHPHLGHGAGWRRLRPPPGRRDRGPGRRPGRGGLAPGPPAPPGPAGGRAGDRVGCMAVARPLPTPWSIPPPGASSPPPEGDFLTVTVQGAQAPERARGSAGR